LPAKAGIYHHNKFQYHDGPTSKKYFILLNEPEHGGIALAVKTTSQPKDRPRTPGCIEARSLFFLPSGSAHFVKDTWVQLYEVYEIAGIESDPDITYFGHLPDKVFKGLIDCLLRTQKEDLTQSQLDILRPQSDSSVEDLKKHFKNLRP